VSITADKPDTKYNPNSNPNPPTNQHEVVSIQLQSLVLFIRRNSYETMLPHHFYCFLLSLSLRLATSGYKTKYQAEVSNLHATPIA